jgi:hypothetical protein
LRLCGKNPTKKKNDYEPVLHLRLAQRGLNFMACSDWKLLEKLPEW